jgi:hypothetical protein
MEGIAQLLILFCESVATDWCSFWQQIGIVYPSSKPVYESSGVLPSMNQYIYYGMTFFSETKLNESTCKPVFKGVLL